MNSPCMFFFFALKSLAVKRGAVTRVISRGTRRAGEGGRGASVRPNLLSIRGWGISPPPHKEWFCPRFSWRLETERDDFSAQKRGTFTVSRQLSVQETEITKKKKKMKNMVKASFSLLQIRQISFPVMINELLLVVNQQQTVRDSWEFLNR